MNLTRFSKKIFTFVIISTISLALIEVTLRIIDPINLVGYTDAYEFDPELGVVAKKNIRYTNLKDYREEFHTNGLGTVNYSENFNSYKKIVYAIGDSFTQGTGLTNDSSYPFQLDMLLNVRNGKYNHDYAVINLGLGGYGSAQELIVLKRYLKTLPKPDYILITGYTNDPWDDYRFQSGLIFKNPMDGNPKYGIFSKPLAWFAFHTETGKHIFTALKKLKQNDSEKSVLNTQSIIESLSQNYAEFVKIAKSQNACVIFTYAAVDSDPNYQALKEWAMLNDASFADWAPIASSIQGSIPNLPLNNDHSGGHFRPWVNQLIAKTFANDIKSMEDGCQRKLTKKTSSAH